MPEVRIDAVAQGDALSLDLAEELAAARAVRHGQPARSRCSSPRRTLTDPRALGRGPPRRASRSAPAAPARAASRSATATRCRSTPGEPADAAVRLEIDRWNGAVSPRLVLRQRRSRAAPARDRACSASPSVRAPGCARELDRDLAGVGARARRARAAAARITRDLRGTGHRRPARGPRRDAASRCSRSTAHAPHRARALAAARRRLRAHLVGRARGRSRPGARRSRTSSRSTRRHGRCSTIRPGRGGRTWRGVRLN